MLAIPSRIEFSIANLGRATNFILRCFAHLSTPATTERRESWSHGGRKRGEFQQVCDKDLQRRRRHCFTTTVIDLDPQLKRRVILRTVDESTIQTRAVMKEQARQFEEIERVTIRSTFVERVISRVRDYRSHSKVDRVVIPFAGKLEEKLPDNLDAVESSHVLEVDSFGRARQSNMLQGIL